MFSAERAAAPCPATGSAATGVAGVQVGTASQVGCVLGAPNPRGDWPGAAGARVDPPAGWVRWQVSLTVGVSALRRGPGVTANLDPPAWPPP